MLDDLNIVLTIAAALGCGTHRRRLLRLFIVRDGCSARLPAGQGIAAMQSINVTVLNRGFLSLFMGTGIAGASAAAIALTDPSEPESILRIAGALLYVIGCLLVTGAFNVPRNNALDALDPGKSDSAAPWSTFVREWTAWNTVRTVGSVAAAAAFTIALVLE